jgi:glutaredoxin 3
VPEVIIYVTPNCAYCVQAKSLLEKLGIPYTKIDISTDEVVRQEMVKRSGGRTSVPQIFIASNHIGGFDNLSALYKAGKLEEYLRH